ncbi:UNVERIFIED_CONTAM: hypothetical protein Slati_2794300 [Sesamum latifolium]|uniref:Uncharacterized protein n=1 Tax=Sesamum latifolium TaxID=2727402 RepID=A0AAW2VD56_9LAMI
MKLILIHLGSPAFSEIFLVPPVSSLVYYSSLFDLHTSSQSGVNPVTSVISVSFPYPESKRHCRHRPAHQVLFRRHYFILRQYAAVHNEQNSPSLDNPEFPESRKLLLKVFQDLISDAVLAPNFKALCLETATGADVFALREIGVEIMLVFLRSTLSNIGDFRGKS